MKASIYMIPIEQLELNFFFDQDHKPAINVEGQTYNSLVALFQSFPILSNPRYREKVAQIVNFLLKGLEFHYIENIEKFKEEYQQQIEYEQLSLEDRLVRLSDYGIYDLSSMHAPAVINGQLIFFVKHDYTQLPYKVSVGFPITSDYPNARYELLPFKSS